jgi:DNA-binding NarL/FixJ family response regulator
VSAVILLVEDEADTREMLGRALERAGYRTALAGTAAEALERARSQPSIDLVVTDIVLGTDDRRGLLLIGELRRLGVLAPVIVITAYADVEKVKIALNEGAAHLLEKPFNATQLLDAIDRVRAQGTNPQPAERVYASAKLTDKERAVARLLLTGLTSNEIAEIERNSPRTIRQHVSQIYAKCGVSSRGEFFRLVYSGQ